MRPWAVGLAVAAGLLPAALAHAQAIQNVVLRNSFNPLGAGARGLGMGGAFIAVADDGTASSFNPAGLTQLRRTELAVVGFSDELRSELAVPNPTGDTDLSTTSLRHHRPDFVGLSVPFAVRGRTLTVQLSYQRAVDLFGQGRATVVDTVDLRDLDPDLRGTGDFIADIAPEQVGAFHTVSASGAYEVTGRLSLGASVNYWLAEWTASGQSSFRLRLHMPGQARPIEVPVVNQTFNQDQSVRGFNVNAGFLLRYARVSLGGLVRLPFTGDYRLRENNVAVAFDAGRPLPPRQAEFHVTTRFHWPRSAGLGLAVRPLRGLTLTADYARSQWSRTSIEDVPGGALLTRAETEPDGTARDTFVDRNFFDLLPESQTATTDTSQWRACAEYLVTFIPKVVIPLRGGIYRDRSPVTELGSLEGRRIDGFTVGTGLNFSRVVLDVAFERRESEGVVRLSLRAGQPVSNPNVPRETVREARIVASLIYRFGPDDPIKRALRYLFVGPDEGESP